jgi:hypothetical protein
MQKANIMSGGIIDELTLRLNNIPSSSGSLLELQKAFKKSNEWANGRSGIIASA